MQTVDVHNEPSEWLVKAVREHGPRALGNRAARLLKVAALCGGAPPSVFQAIASFGDETHDEATLMVDDLREVFADCPESQLRLRQIRFDHWWFVRSDDIAAAFSRYVPALAARLTPAGLAVWGMIESRVRIAFEILTVDRPAFDSWPDLLGATCSNWDELDLEVRGMLWALGEIPYWKRPALAGFGIAYDDAKHIATFLALLVDWLDHHAAPWPVGDVDAVGLWKLAVIGKVEALIAVWLKRKVPKRHHDDVGTEILQASVADIFAEFRRRVKRARKGLFDLKPNGNAIDASPVFAHIERVVARHCRKYLREQRLRRLSQDADRDNDDEISSVRNLFQICARETDLRPINLGTYDEPDFQKPLETASAFGLVKAKGEGREIKRGLAPRDHDQFAWVRKYLLRAQICVGEVVAELTGGNPAAFAGVLQAGSTIEARNAFGERTGNRRPAGERCMVEIAAIARDMLRPGNDSTLRQLLDDIDGEAAIWADKKSTQIGNYHKTYCPVDYADRAKAELCRQLVPLVAGGKSASAA